MSLENFLETCLHLITLMESTCEVLDFINGGNNQLFTMCLHKMQFNWIMDTSFCY